MTASEAITIVQARMLSTRLPGKVLMPIGDRPMVLHVLERAAEIGEPVVLATSHHPADDPLAKTASDAGWTVFRGDPDDVLDRFVHAIPTTTRYVVRVTADCPFLDPSIGRSILATLRNSGVDYVSNTLEPTFPDGLDSEALTVAALRRAWEETELKSDREHVTTHVWRQPDRYRLWSLRHVPDLSGERWTVDDERDMEFARALERKLATVPASERMSMYSVLAILDREPELRLLNQGTHRNEGLAKDIEEERRAVQVRPMAWADRQRVFAWSNDLETRRNSFQTQPIQWDEHLEWMRRKLEDPESHTYIGVIGDRPFATVQFERSPDGDAEIGVNIEARFRGKGLAVPLLEASRAAYLGDAGPRRIRARVKSFNARALRAFENAGYVRTGREEDGLTELTIEAPRG
jgi:spore coat polysaccharide biosynthesis protein SpsF